MPNAININLLTRSAARPRGRVVEVMQGGVQRTLRNNELLGFACFANFATKL